MMSTSDSFKMFNERVRKFLWILGLHAFSLILFFVFLDFILGGIIFYQYVFLAENESPRVAGNTLKFNVQTYQQVLGELQTREQGN